MPEVIEDEQAQVREFLEQQRLLEEEHLRREEAAALLAEQDALAAQAIIPQGGNFFSQPQPEIDALQAQFNQPLPSSAFVPAMPRQMIGDELYQAEVARAQRGSGFINADIGPGGNVITPGYDPSIDFAALKAQEEATNLQRNAYVDSLIKGGATYAEAYRAGQGRHPQKGNDAMRLKIEELAQKQATSLMQPEVITIDGVRAFRTGPKSFSRIPDKTETAPKAVMPPDAAASQKIISGQITDARAALTRAQKAVEEDRTDVNAVNAALRAREKLRGLEQSLVVGSTNWMGAAQAPTGAIAPIAPQAPIAAATPAQAKAVNADSIREQFRAGKISREEAKKALKALGFE